MSRIIVRSETFQTTLVNRNQQYQKPLSTEFHSNHVTF